MIFVSCGADNIASCEEVYFDRQVAAKQELIASAEDCTYMGDWEGPCLQLVNNQYILSLAEARIQYQECLGIELV